MSNEKDKAKKVEEPDEADVWEDALTRALEAEADRYEKEQQSKPKEENKP